MLWYGKDSAGLFRCCMWGGGVVAVRGELVGVVGGGCVWARSSLGWVMSSVVEEVALAAAAEVLAASVEAVINNVVSGGLTYV